MRRIAANYIFPLSSKPIKNGILVFDDNNVIIDLIDNNGALIELEKTEFYNGIIIPGAIVFLNELAENKEPKLVEKVLFNKGIRVVVYKEDSWIEPLKTDSKVEFIYANSKPHGIIEAKSISSCNLNTQFIHLQNQEAQLTFESLLCSIILNVSRILKINNRFGSFEIGKSPGAVLIEKYDFENKTISLQSSLKRLV